MLGLAGRQVTYPISPKPRRILLLKGGQRERGRTGSDVGTVASLRLRWLPISRPTQAEMTMVPDPVVDHSRVLQHSMMAVIAKPALAAVLRCWLSWDLLAWNSAIRAGLPLQRVAPLLGFLYLTATLLGRISDQPRQWEVSSPLPT